MSEDEVVYLKVIKNKDKHNDIYEVFVFRKQGHLEFEEIKQQKVQWAHTSWNAARLSYGVNVSNRRITWNANNNYNNKDSLNFIMFNFLF